MVRLVEAVPPAATRKSCPPAGLPASQTHRLALKSRDRLELRLDVVRDRLEPGQELLALLDDRLVLEHVAVVGKVDLDLGLLEVGRLDLGVGRALAEGGEGLLRLAREAELGEAGEVDGGGGGHEGRWGGGLEGGEEE